MEDARNLNEFHLHPDLLTDVSYTDDTTLTVSWIYEKLNMATLELDCSCKKWGMKIYAAK